MKVPTYDNMTVSPAVKPLQPMQNVVNDEGVQFAARQMQQLGQAESRAGGMMAQVMIEEQDHQNRLRVDDALNKAREQMLDMRYNKQTGYSNLLGVNALNRPDNKSLVQEYDDNLGKGIESLSASLGNDAQREMFNSEATRLRQQFGEGVMQHMAQQSRTYELSVREGTIATRRNEIGLNYNNPDVVRNGIDSIMAAASDLTRLKGLSGVEAEEFGRQNASAALSAAASAAILQGDFSGATNLINTYKTYVTPEDANALDSKLRPVLEGEQALRIYENMNREQAATGFSPEVQTAIKTAAQTYGIDEHLLNRIASLESSGNPLARNPSGATGLFQFTADTASQYGLTDRRDPVQSADAAARLVRDNAATLRRSLGRDATPAELYLAHQQGAGGAAALLAHPEKPAVEALAAAYGGDVGKATQAILRNGGSPMMTAKGFTDLWAHKLGMGQAAPAEGAASAPRRQTRDDILALAGGNSRVADMVYKIQQDTIRAQNEARKAAETEASNAAWQFEASNINNPSRWSTTEGRQVLQNLYAVKPELAAKFIGQDVETDYSVYQDVLTRINAGDDVHIQDYADRLSSSDMKSLVDRQSSPETILRSRLTDSVINDLKPIIEGGEKDNSIKARRVVMFSNKLDVNIRDFMRMNNGNPPSRQDVQVMADQLLQETNLVTPGGSWTGGDSTRVAPRFMSNPNERPDFGEIDRIAENTTTRHRGTAVFTIKGVSEVFSYDALIAKLTADLRSMGYDASDKSLVEQHYNDLLENGLIGVRTQ